MTLFRRVPLLALCALTSLSAAVAAAAAEDGGTVRLACANPQRILQQMQETKDRNAAMEGERASLISQEKAKIEEITTLRKQRDELLKKGTPDYRAKTEEILKKTTEVQIWAKVKEEEVNRRHKEGIKDLFDKISAAIEQIAKEKKIDIVIADYSVDLPDDVDSITPEQLHAMIRQKNVLFAGKGVDISSEVVTRLDAGYKK
jgi:Skp family chaperone for outer membrane proteins